MSGPETGTLQVLTERCGWQVAADFETVYVLSPAGRRWEIGWMYGLPRGALITADEGYAAVVGCGVLLADLTQFGEEPGEGQSWAQSPVLHLLAEPGEHWFFEGIYAAPRPGAVRLVAELSSEQAGIYELDLTTLQLRPCWPETGHWG